MVLARLESEKVLVVVGTSAHNGNMEELDRFLLEYFGYDAKKEKAKREQIKREHHLVLVRRHYKYREKWRKNNPEKFRVYGKIHSHPERYPLDDHCFYCGTTEKLERGHIDYEDDGYNYLTVCSKCNKWMSKDESMITKAREFLVEREE